jgi:phosphatidylethanolamine/phosphatidyl-N-methylethanolamine N-methyltransferase
MIKRFLRRPLQVAYLLPSSKKLVERTMNQMDLSVPRVVVELGPGEGVQTREFLKRATKDSRLIILEIDPIFANHVREQFSNDPRVEVVQGDARELAKVLAERSVEKIDYLFSGIPFRFFSHAEKSQLLNDIHSLLKPGGAFISYQTSRELHRFAQNFASVKASLCLSNLPPMWVSKYQKAAQ